jgi:hypothetical protein
MIVKIVDSAGGLTAEVAEPNAFKGLHVEVPARVSSDALSRLLVEHGIGDVVGSDGDEAVALSIEWLRSHADDQAGFDAMVAYADSKGWVLPGNAVRAHIVRS